jgi:hypothetical protein
LRLREKFVPTFAPTGKARASRKNFVGQLGLKNWGFARWFNGPIWVYFGGLGMENVGIFL